MSQTSPGPLCPSSSATSSAAASSGCAAATWCARPTPTRWRRTRRSLSTPSSIAGALLLPAAGRPDSGPTGWRDTARLSVGVGVVVEDGVGLASDVLTPVRLPMRITRARIVELAAKCSNTRLPARSAASRRTPTRRQEFLPHGRRSATAPAMRCLTSGQSQGLSMRGIGSASASSKNDRLLQTVKRPPSANFSS